MWLLALFLGAWAPNTIVTWTGGIQYRIERQIGEGGFGTAYLATRVNGPPGAPEQVVLKTIKTSAARFVSNGFQRIATDLNASPSNRILRYSGTWMSDGEFVLKSDYAGTDLGRWISPFLSSEGSLLPNAPLLQIHDIAKQATEALMDFHAAGWIHNDVKPQNFFVLNGRVVIADFDGATRPGERRGAHTFEVPELSYRLNNTSVASDYYALGVSLYVMLFGRTPDSDFVHSALSLNHSSTQPASNDTEGEFRGFVRGKFDALRTNRVLSSAELAATRQLEQAILALLSPNPRDRVVGIQLLGVNRRVPPEQLTRIRQLDLPNVSLANRLRNVCEAVWSAVGHGFGNLIPASR